MGAAMNLEKYVLRGVLRGWEDGQATFQFVESVDWIPQWGIRYALGIAERDRASARLASGRITWAASSGYGHSRTCHQSRRRPQ